MRLWWTCLDRSLYVDVQNWNFRKDGTVWKGVMQIVHELVRVCTGWHLLGFLRSLRVRCLDCVDTWIWWTWSAVLRIVKIASSRMIICGSKMDRKSCPLEGERRCVWERRGFRSASTIRCHLSIVVVVLTHIQWDLFCLDQFLHMSYLYKFRAEWEGRFIIFWSRHRRDKLFWARTSRSKLRPGGGTYECFNSLYLNYY